MSLIVFKMSFKAIDFPGPESNSGSCIAFGGNGSLETYHLEKFFSLRLLRLIFLKNIDQLFCRLSLNLGLSDILLCLNSGSKVFIGMSQSNVGFFSLHPTTRCNRLMGSITSDF